MTTETYDMHGRKLTLEKNPTAGVHKAFENSDFVTVSKKNLNSLLQEVIDRQNYSNHTGPRCISYEKIDKYSCGRALFKYATYHKGLR